MSANNDSTSYNLIVAVREGKIKTVRELITSFGLSYSKSWSNGYVLLRDAVKNEHTAIIKLLLRSGSKVNSKSKKRSDTPLHFAVKNGDAEIVELLLDAGAAVDAKNRDGTTSLYNAVFDDFRKIEIIKLLLNRRANVDHGNREGVTPLHIAATKGDLEIVRLLLEHGAYVNSASTSTYRQPYVPVIPLDYEKFIQETAARYIPYEAIDLMGPLRMDYMQANFLCDTAHRLNNKYATYWKGCTPIFVAVEKQHEAVVELLLECNANVDSEDKNGTTILHLAIKKGNSIIINTILNFSPNVHNKDNRSALRTAALGRGREYRKVVEIMLQKGFIVTPEDVNDRDLLRTAIEKGYLQIIEQLLQQGADVNIVLHRKTKQGKGYMPLHIAAIFKQEEAVKLLLNHGAYINARDTIGRTPIFYAIKRADLKIYKLLINNRARVKGNSKLLNIAVRRQCKEMVEDLLQRGADINASDRHGRTPLHFTGFNAGVQCFQDKVYARPMIKKEIAQLLLSRGANVNARQRNGKTTLHYAAENGYVKVVQTLLEYNADVNLAIMDKNSTTALHIAVYNGCMKILKMLLNKGANINAKQCHGVTSLHIATFQSRINAVEELLKHGAQVDCKMKFGRTALHVAVRRYFPEMIEVLVKYGADIDSKDEAGNTALHIAIEKGTTPFVQMVKVLLKHGLDINITNNKNQTPLDCAMDRISSLRNRTTLFDLQDDLYGTTVSEHVGKTLQRHIVKMKTANLYVNESDLLSLSTYSEVNDVLNKYNEELARMKSKKINNTNYSFYDIWTNGLDRLISHTRNENIEEILYSNDYKINFPIYSTMMESIFRKAKIRKPLLEEGYKLFPILFNNVPVLPYNCNEKIIGYLSNYDLAILKRAFEKEEGRNELLEQDYPMTEVCDFITSEILVYNPFDFIAN